MSTVRTLIRRVEQEYGYPEAAEALRQASARVVVRQEDNRLGVYIDGSHQATYRTSNGNEGLWKWTSGDGDGWYRDGAGIETPIYSWHQIIGTCQISGKGAVRGWVVEMLAEQETA